MAETNPATGPEQVSPAMVLRRYLTGIPAGTPIDGAVAELSQAADGTISAEIRIPAPVPAAPEAS